MTRADSAEPLLSIVIPAYNEGRRLGPALAQIREYLERTGTTAEIIVVDDGSTDDTAEVAERFDPGAIPLRVFRNDGNRGKGYSVRRGFLAAAGKLLLMTDADQSTPLWEIEKLTPHLEAGCKVVIGSRELPDSEVSPPQGWPRRVLGKLLRLVRGWIMLHDIRDTQCGFKCFTREAGRRIFARLKTRRFAFDCEALLLARKLGYRICEVGVVWCNDRDSRVRLVRDSLEMIVSLVRIRWRLRRVAAEAPDAA